MQEILLEALQVSKLNIRSTRLENGERRLEKMEIFLKNVGKLKEARVKLQSITVVAGENGSGKSTIGKVLFSTFSALNEVEEKIKTLKQEALERELSRRQNLFYSRASIHSGEIIPSLLQLQDKTEKKIEEMLNEFFSDEKQGIIVDSDLVDSVSKILSIDDEHFLKRVVTLSFYREFSGQISNVYNRSDAQVELKVKDNNIRIVFDNKQQCREVCSPIALRRAIYFDDPFVLDELKYRIFPPNRWGTVGTEHHSTFLKQLLVNEQKDVIGEILNEERYMQLKNKIQQISGGKITKDTSRFFYVENGKKERIEVSNLATGLKTFMVLQILIENGQIVEKDVLILDEPEVHLHPKWQIVFAEIIVLLQNAFNLHILINTHSPYFLKALQVYIKKHQVSNAHYYLAIEDRRGYSHLEEVDDRVEDIYKKFAEPFGLLEAEQ